MNDVVTCTPSFALMGLMFVGLSIPLIRGLVPPNLFYGFRTPKTLSSEKIWYEANRTSGNDLFLAGAFITISSLSMLLFARAWDPKLVATTLLLVMILSLLGVVIHGFSAIRRM